VVTKWRRDQAVGEKGSLEGEIVRLAATAREYHLVRRATDKIADLPTRLFHQFPCGHACPVPTRRITKAVCQSLLHRGGDFGRDAGAGVVVEINLLHFARYQLVVGDIGNRLGPMEWSGWRATFWVGSSWAAKALGVKFPP